MTPEEQIADHEKRIAALEEDDAKVHGVLTKVTDWCRANPWVSNVISAVAMAALLWLAQKFGVVVPPVPPPTPPASAQQDKGRAPTVLPEPKDKPNNE